MKPTILITDTLFISEKYEQQLTAAGFEIERKPGNLTEDELLEALKGKIGYIVGGMENATDKVLAAATDLKAIAFTGSDWAHFIPGHPTATKNGVKITNTPGTTKYAVAEFTITMLLMMLRRALEVGNTGDKTSLTTQSLASSHVGIVGLGSIGSEVARMLKALGCAKVSYWDRNQKNDLEKELGIGYLPLEKLMAECDVISNHLSSQAGTILNARLIGSTKDGVLFVNAGAVNSFDYDALYKQITTKNARAAVDMHGKPGEQFDSLPLSNWYITNENSAYNTRQMLDMTDDMATTSIINVLTKGTDQHIANL